MNVRIGWLMPIDAPPEVFASPQASKGTRGGALAEGSSGTIRTPAMTRASASLTTFEESIVTVPPPFPAKAAGAFMKRALFIRFGGAL